MFIEKWSNKPDMVFDRDKEPKDLVRDDKISVLLGMEISYRWISFVEVEIARNYKLFSLLADVRNINNIEPISPPRGVPDDASFFYIDRVESWSDDGHSHSYYLLSELLNIDWDSYKATYPDIYLDSFLNEIELLQKLPIFDDPDNFRLVFFFDN
jgi:hypothetical protein